MLSIKKVIEFTTDGLNIQNLLNTLLCLSLKKPSYFSWEFQESLKKHYCADLVIPCLLYVNLNYSVNILPSCHSIYIFNCCSHVSTFKITFYFNLKHEGLCSQVLRMCEHLFWAALLGWCNYMWKYCSWRWDSLFVKARSHLLKYSPSWDGIIFTFNEKCIF